MKKVSPAASAGPPRSSGLSTSMPSNVSAMYWIIASWSIQIYLTHGPMTRSHVCSKRRSGQWHEHGHPRFRADLARRVTLTREVFGDQNVARAEATNRSVTSFDVDRSRQGDHGIPS